jgi:hypothetical protein
MDVPAEIEGLKMAVNNLGNQITQLIIMVQDIRDCLPGVQENLQRPGKSPEMAAALAKISELEESIMEGFKPICFGNSIDTRDVEMHHWDVEKDHLTPEGEKVYLEKAKTPFTNNNAKATPSSTNINPNFSTSTISKAKPTTTIIQINRPKDQSRKFSQFPAPLSSVYEELLMAGLLKPLSPTPLPQKLPAYHNPNAFCAFHQVPGHATNNCQRLCHKIQDLIDDKTISLLPSKSNTPQQKQDLSVNQISLTSTKNAPSSFTNNDPNQTEPVNEVTTQINRPLIRRRKFSQLSAPLPSVYKELLMAGFLKPLQPTPPPQSPPRSYNPNTFCIYHQIPGHPTERCQRLRHEIQDLIDNGSISAPLAKPSTSSNQ